MADISGGFHFLKLPPEVRNMVYEKLLVKRKPIQMSRPKARPQSKPSILAVFTLSKQIHQEALSIYFGSNVFCAGGLVILAKFLLNIGPNACNAIRAVSIYYQLKHEYSEHEIGFERLAQCGSLRKIHLLIRCFYSCDKGRARGDHVPLLKRAGIQSLLKTRGIRELDVEVKDQTFKLACAPEVYEKEKESLMQALQIVKEPRDLPKGRLELLTEHDSGTKEGKKEGKKKKKKKKQSKPSPLPKPAEIASKEVLVQGSDDDLSEEGEIRE